MITRISILYFFFIISWSTEFKRTYALRPERIKYRCHMDLKVTIWPIATKVTATARDSFESHDTQGAAEDDLFFDEWGGETSKEINREAENVKYASEAEDLIDSLNKRLDNNYKENKKLPNGLREFRDYAQKGIDLISVGKIGEALAALNSAVQANVTQALPLRGILHYSIGNYNEALEQLDRDIDILEKKKFLKAGELRVWRAACLYKLGRSAEQVVESLDLSNALLLPVYQESLLMNKTLQLFSGDDNLGDLLELIGSADEKDVTGSRFYGNLFIGVYYDAIGMTDMAKSFLLFPAQSERYGKSDMWRHIPRILFCNRFPDSVHELPSNSSPKKIESKRSTLFDKFWGSEDIN